MNHKATANPKILGESVNTIPGTPLTDTAADPIKIVRTADPDTKQNMRLIEASGVLDFWARPEEDVYSDTDGEPI